MERVVKRARINKDYSAWLRDIFEHSLRAHFRASFNADVLKVRREAREERFTLPIITTIKSFLLRHGNDLQSQASRFIRRNIGRGACARIAARVYQVRPMEATRLVGFV